MATQTGKRNKLIAIYKPNPAKDAYNRPVDGLVVHKQKYAEVRTVSGMASIRDEAQGGINNNGVPYSFRVLFDESITQEMSVMYRGTLFNIKRVIHDYQDKDHTDIVCETGRG